MAQCSGTLSMPDLNPSLEPKGTMAIDYRYQLQYTDATHFVDYDFTQYYDNLNKNLTDAFSAARIEIPVLNRYELIWDQPFTRTSLRDFYLSHPPDPGFPYFVFGARELVDDFGEPLREVIGMSSHGLIPGQVAEDKYTFIFTESIRRGFDKRVFAQALIHELGHVRAGLTHPLDQDTRFFEYHVAEQDDQFSSCVMHQLADIPQSDQDPKQPDIAQILGSLAFCGIDRDGNETHCIHYLKQTNF